MGKLYNGEIDTLIQTARKEGDKNKLRTYQNVKKALQDYATSQNAKPLTDEKEFEVIRKYLKELRDDVATYDGKRQELADEANGEIPYVLELIPKEATEDDIRKVVEDWLSTKSSFTNKDFGEAMKHVRSVLSNANGKTISDILKSYL